MNVRELDAEDLMTAVHSIKRVTGCKEVLIGGRGALVACHGSSGALRATRDFDIAITEEGSRTGIETFSEELGRESHFASEHDFYIEHAGEDLLTYVLPPGWRDRAIHMETDGVTVLCLAPVDIAINKLNANRPKDIDHLVMMIRDQVVTRATIDDAMTRCPYPFMIEGYRKTLAEVMDRLKMES